MPIVGPLRPRDRRWVGILVKVLLAIWAIHPRTRGKRPGRQPLDADKIAAAFLDVRAAVLDWTAPSSMFRRRYPTFARQIATLKHQPQRESAQLCMVSCAAEKMAAGRTPPPGRLIAVGVR